MRAAIHALPTMACLTAFVLACAGCETVAAPASSAAGEDGRVARVRAAAVDITPCTTTETQLRERLGAPTRDGRLGAGRVVSWMGGEDAGGIVRYLAVLLDARGTVVDVYWDLPTEIPWTPEDHCTMQ